jgi:predicted AAA+ superfamily ATPase
MIIKRLFAPLLQEMLATFPVVAVVGSRQVGKSTLIQQPLIAHGRRYLTLEDVGAYSVAQADPKTFLDSEMPLSIDEVQLAARLCGLTSIEALRASPMLGRLVETLAMMEIQALLPLAETPAKLFHVRTHNGLEVDGLLEIGQRHLPIEIKASRTVTASDAAPIEKWISLNPTHGPGIVLHLGEEYLPLSPNVRAVPAQALFGAPT